MLVFSQARFPLQTQSLALRALRKRKPQATQALALASSQSWLPLLRPSIPIGWRLRLLREIQRKRLRLNGNRASVVVNYRSAVDHGLLMMFCRSLARSKSSAQSR